MAERSAIYELRGFGMAALALLAGALAGAAITTSPAALMAMGRREGYGFAFVIFLAAFAVWSLGLVTFGAPAWCALHRRGLRSRGAALILGAGLASAVGFTINVVLGLMIGEGYSSGDSGGDIWIGGHLTFYGWSQDVLGAVVLGLLGAMVGWVVWRVAYRRAH